MTKATDFAAAYDRVAKETSVDLAVAKSEVINQTALLILRNTPVRTGRLRASWYFSNSLAARAGVGAEAKSTGSVPAATLARISAERAFTNLAGTVYFLNGASYAIFVEARTQFLSRALAKTGQIATNATRAIRALQGRR